MIRNAIAYRLPHGWPHSAHETAQLLSRLTFHPCGPMDSSAHGFVAPREDAELCADIGNRYLICHQHEEKILPASVVNEYVEIRCEDIEQHQGYRPGRKQRKEIKELVTSELLPQAFTKKRRTLAWISLAGGWLIVDSASVKRAEDVLSAMRLAMGELPVDLLRTNVNAARSMLQWMESQEAPGGFTIDRECELVSHAEDEGVVRYANWDLGGEDVRYQLSIGRAPTLLGLTFSDRISFILTNRLELRRIALLGVNNEVQQGADASEIFDGEFTLDAAEIEHAIDALVAELGGLVVDEKGDLVDQAGETREAVAA